MNFKNYKLGVIPSPKDDRDYKISKLTTKEYYFPKEFSRWVPQTKDQGNINSCVAHAIAYIKENIEREQNEKTGNEYDKFSVGFLYGHREPTDYQGEGMIPREALKNLLKYGNPLLKDFSYNEEYPQITKKLNMIINELLDVAHPYRISAYARLYSEEEIKTALLKVSPVLIACPVYESLYTPNSSGIVSVPKSTERVLGYHAMTIFGWVLMNNKEYWLVQNSWGNNYGLGGVFLMDKEYPIEELWSVTDNILPNNDEDNKVEFTDIENHWAKEYIEKCVKEGLLRGYEDGTFKPDNNVTRAELATVLSRLKR